jgi:hypothetical protein
MTGTRSFRSKLKVLAASFCGRCIQDSSDGHDPTEDAIAAMELVLMKMKMGTVFGDVFLIRYSFPNSFVDFHTKYTLSNLIQFVYLFEGK